MRDAEDRRIHTRQHWCHKARRDLECEQVDGADGAPSPKSAASIWEGATGGAIGDELLEWPPNLFALTQAILGRSETHRLLLSPPPGACWPPPRIPGWAAAVEDAGKAWAGWVDDRREPLPEIISEEWKVLRAGAETPIERLVDGTDWRLCEALITLHAIADEACAGLGLALDRSGPDGCVYRARGRELLARTGSLARLPSKALRVLPKARTAPSGSSLRTLSRYVCTLGPEIDVRWKKIPARRRGVSPEAEAVNMLLLPWPLRVRESDFRALEGSVRGLGGERFGMFEFAPSERLDLDLLDRVILAAKEEVNSVDGVCLPEGAIREDEISQLEALLDVHGVAFVIAGVRGRRDEEGLAGNWVHAGFSPKLDKGGREPEPSGEQWFHIAQPKLNRWALDEAQIYQYHLGGALHPNVRWWEGIDVPARTLQFVELGEGITLVFLVCEDLAQSDGLADVIRSVAPTGVIVCLLDGPQLSSRWAARYASVLADDPGSAVLTLTAFGMAQRCRPPGHVPSRSIGLSKAPARGERTIDLEPGSAGVLLTNATDRIRRRSIDGRRPVGNATDIFHASITQVGADRPASSRPTSPPLLAPAALDVDDLTVLSGWAEALAEMLAAAPERAENVIAQARPAAPWRIEFGIPPLSSALAEAIESLARAVRPVVGDAALTFDSVLDSALADVSGKNALDGLARRVLRSSLEQRRTREADESMDS